MIEVAGYTERSMHVNCDLLALHGPSIGPLAFYTELEWTWL